MKMSAEQLKSIRTSMNLDIVSMVAILGWKYRTYQDRELGNRGIPDKAAEQVLAAQRHNAEVMNGIKNRLAVDIEKKFPSGILSVVE